MIAHRHAARAATLPAALLFAILCVTPDPADALIITIGGDFVAGPAVPPAPNCAGPLDIGKTCNTGILNFQPAGPGVPDHRLSFRVISTNNGHGGSVVLTDLLYRSDVAGPVTQTIRIQASHVLAPDVTEFADADHYFRGDVTFQKSQAEGDAPKQRAQVEKTAKHEDDPLFDLVDGKDSGAAPPPQVVAISAGPEGAVTPPIEVTGPNYDMDILYTFTLIGGSAGAIPGWVQIAFPDSGVDRWAAEGFDLPIVDAPEPGIPALLGLGLALLAARRRRA